MDVVWGVRRDLPKNVCMCVDVALKVKCYYDYDFSFIQIRCGGLTTHWSYSIKVAASRVQFSCEPGSVPRKLELVEKVVKSQLHNFVHVIQAIVLKRKMV